VYAYATFVSAAVSISLEQAVIAPIPKKGKAVSSIGYHPGCPLNCSKVLGFVIHYPILYHLNLKANCL
jgi:hypothetical protein